jgi:hypothetical protein
LAVRSCSSLSMCVRCVKAEQQVLPTQNKSHFLFIINSSIMSCISCRAVAVAAAAPAVAGLWLLVVWCAMPLHMGNGLITWYTGYWTTILVHMHGTCIPALSCSAWIIDKPSTLDLLFKSVQARVSSVMCLFSSVMCCLEAGRSAARRPSLLCLGAISGL